MSIVTFSDALIQRLGARDVGVLRDRVLCGLCLKVGARTRTFLIATSVRGKQFRMTIGRWPLVTVDQARERALGILRSCRAGQVPAKEQPSELPMLRAAMVSYAKAKGLKASSCQRYDSLLRTHFGDWLDRSIEDLGTPAFYRQCQAFAESQGKAVVEVGRGLVGALCKYVNAVHGLELESPFVRLGAAGLLPERAQPRARRLRDEDLHGWYEAVQQLPELQRDYLMLILLTGLRRGECASLTVSNIDWKQGVLCIEDTKTNVPHSLPITEHMAEILQRRSSDGACDATLFAGVKAEHVAEMAQRAGAPRFMLHDLRKLLASVGGQLGIGDAVLRRILNHKAKKSDTLHRHYVQLSAGDVRCALASIQGELLRRAG